MNPPVSNGFPVQSPILRKVYLVYVYGWFSVLPPGALKLMMTLSNGNIFRVSGSLWGESNGHRGIPSPMPLTRSFDIFFNVRLNNGWANSRYAGDLRRHGAHCDVLLKLTGTHQMALWYFQMVPSRHRRGCHYPLWLMRWNTEDCRPRLKSKNIHLWQRKYLIPNSHPPL